MCSSDLGPRLSFRSKGSRRNVSRPRRSPYILSGRASAHSPITRCRLCMPMNPISMAHVERPEAGGASTVYPQTPVLRPGAEVWGGHAGTIADLWCERRCLCPRVIAECLSWRITTSGRHLRRVERERRVERMCLWIRLVSTRCGGKTIERAENNHALIIAI